MFSLEHAKETFHNYVSQYDLNDPKIALKVRHTYAVVDACGYLADSLELDEENRDLALLIGLLHDIGRFEQLTRFNSYDDNLLPHAECGLEVLFDQNNIRSYIESDRYDDIIYAAIKNHSLFAIDPAVSGQTLLHAKIIRDADKLDNFRVKAVDPIEAMLDVDEEYLGADGVSDNIFRDFMEHRPILKADRHTKLDMWISYLAFIYDFNFPASYQYVLDHHCIESNIDRIRYTNPDTAEKMAAIRAEAISFCREKCSRRDL